MNIGMENGEHIPQWLSWARQMQALAQTGLHYAKNEYEKERYLHIQQIAAEMMAVQTAVPAEVLLRGFSLQAGYATPKVDVRAAVFQDGKILMVKERTDGTWAMPGGWADVGDLPSQAAERETWEETSVKVKAIKVIGVYDCNRMPPMNVYHAYKLVYLCQVLEGQPRTSRETVAVRYVAADEVPLDLLAERTSKRHLDDAFAALKNPDSPTVFD